MKKEESTTVNHGKLNEILYGKPNLDSIKHNNSTLAIAHNYFHAYKHRSTYMVAMKYHTAKIANDLNWTMQEIANLLNLKNHATVNHLLKHYVPLKEHNKFIKDHYMDYIQGMLYPVRGRDYHNEKYTLIHISKIKVNEKRQQAPEPKLIPKEWPKF